MFSAAVHVKFTQNKICSLKIQCCIKAYLLQKIVGHVMFGTSLRLLRLEKSQRVVNNSPCYRVSAAFFYGSNFDASVEPVELCREKRTALPSTRWWEAGSITRAGSTTPPNHGLSAGSRQNINSAKRIAVDLMDTMTRSSVKHYHGDSLW